MSFEGYIKLWRRLLDWPLWRDGNNDFCRVVVTLMLRANWRDEQRWVAGKMMTVPRGSLLITRSELAAACGGLSERNIRTIEAHLATDFGDGPFLTRKPTPSGTLYSIVKYDFYQTDQSSTDTTTDTRPTPDRHPTDNPLYKKDQEGEEVLHAPASPSKPSVKRSKGSQQSLLPASKYTPSTEAWRLAQDHRDRLLKLNPQASCGGPRWSKRQWAEQYETGRQETAAEPLPWSDIADALEWALEDMYWCSRVPGPAALFRHWDTITGQMNRPSKSSSSSSDYARGYEPFPGDEVAR